MNVPIAVAVYDEAAKIQPLLRSWLDHTARGARDIKTMVHAGGYTDDTPGPARGAGRSRLGVHVHVQQRRTGTERSGHLSARPDPPEVVHPFRICR